MGKELFILRKTSFFSFIYFFFLRWKETNCPKHQIWSWSYVSCFQITSVRPLQRSALAKTKQKLFDSHAQRCAAYMTSEPSLFDFFSTCSQKGLTNFQEADYPGLPGSSASLYPDFSEN